MEFKVGDIITGKIKTCYRITNSNAIMEVIKIIGNNQITVKILSTKNERFNRCTGFYFNVDPKYFKLYNKIKNLEV